MRRSSLLAALVVTSSLGGACTAELVADAPGALTSPVVGGVAIDDDGEVGATVSLFFTDMGESGCTGTLIAPRVVATAAHCLEGVAPSTLEIVVGAARPADADASRHHAVASATAHPEYSGRGYPTDDPAGLSDERDIGVVVLADDVLDVTPAPVVAQAAFDDVLVAGAPVTLAGFGLTAESDDADYGRLYVADAPFARRSLSEMLVGGPGEADTCYGDSGGPAYVVIGGVRHLAGITSRGSWLGDGSCGSGGIYTLFGAFADFVTEASGGAWTGEGDVDLPPPPPPPDDPASCVDSCEIGSSYDGTCFCDPLCEQNGDCCADFHQACPDVGSWTCSLDELEDDACDCDCGAPDPACADDACASPSADDDPADDDPAADPAQDGGGGDDDVPPPPRGCSSLGAPAPLWLVAGLLGLGACRRRTWTRARGRAS